MSAPPGSVVSPSHTGFPTAQIAFPGAPPAGSSPALLQPSPLSPNGTRARHTTRSDLASRLTGSDAGLPAHSTLPTGVQVSNMTGPPATHSPVLWGASSRDLPLGSPISLRGLSGRIRPATEAASPVAMSSGSVGLLPVRSAATVLPTVNNAVLRPATAYFSSAPRRTMEAVAGIPVCSPVPGYFHRGDERSLMSHSVSAVAHAPYLPAPGGRERLVTDQYGQAIGGNVKSTSLPFRPSTVALHSGHMGSGSASGPGPGLETVEKGGSSLTQSMQTSRSELRAILEDEKIELAELKRLLINLKGGLASATEQAHQEALQGDEFSSPSNHYAGVSAITPATWRSASPPRHPKTSESSRLLPPKSSPSRRSHQQHVEETTTIRASDAVSRRSQFVRSRTFHGRIEVAIGKLRGNALPQLGKDSSCFVQFQLVRGPPSPESPLFDSAIQTWPRPDSRHSIDKTRLFRDWSRLNFQSALRVEIESLEDTSNLYGLIIVFEKPSPSEDSDGGRAVPRGQVAVPIAEILDPEGAFASHQALYLEPCPWSDNSDLLEDAALEVRFRLLPFAHSKGRQDSSEPPPSKAATECQHAFKCVKCGCLLRRSWRPGAPSIDRTQPAGDPRQPAGTNYSDVHHCGSPKPLLEGTKAVPSTAATASDFAPPLVPTSRAECGAMKAGPMSIGGYDPRIVSHLSSNTTSLGDRPVSLKGGSPTAGSHLGHPGQVRSLPGDSLTSTPKTTNSSDSYAHTIEIRDLEVWGLPLTDDIAKCDPFVRIELRKNAPPFRDPKNIVQGCRVDTIPRRDTTQASWATEKLRLSIPKVELTRLNVRSAGDFLLYLKVMDWSRFGAPTLFGTVSFTLKEAVSVHGLLGQSKTFPLVLERSMASAASAGGPEGDDIPGEQEEQSVVNRTTDSASVSAEVLGGIGGVKDGSLAAGPLLRLALKIS